MTLRYVTLLEYPSRLGNRLQVLKMSEAFSLLADFELWVKRFPEDPRDIVAEYGVSGPIHIKRLGALRGLWPKSFWAAARLRKEIKGEPQETVFYMRDVLLAFFLTVLSARFRKNFVFEIHSLGKFPSFMYGRIFRRAQKIISTNSAKKEAICAGWGIKPQKILVAPNGVDLRLFESLPSREEARREFGLALNKKIVMYTGSEQKWKGTNIIEELAKKFSDVLFVRVSSHLAVRPPNDLDIRVLPWVPYAKLPRMLAAADVLLITARKGDRRSERWTSPIKIPTYMASGVPIAAPRTSAVEELLDDSSAFLAKENDPVSLAEQVRFALQNTEEAERRALLAREKARELDWRARAKSILAFTQTN